METILGKVDDPLFPTAGLDMVVVVWVYHMLDDPVGLLAGVIPSGKPGATVLILDPVPEEVELRQVRASGNKKATINVPTKERVEMDAGLAGFELVQAMQGFVEIDNLFILREKCHSSPRLDSRVGAA